MVLGQIFERFIEDSPVSVMVRSLLEKILSPQKLDELFERSSQTQYTRELLFSTVVEIMSSVSCGIRPSIHMEATMRHLKGTLPDWLPSYRVKILDGNALAATEHHLKPLRSCNSMMIAISPKEWTGKQSLSLRIPEIPWVLPYAINRQLHQLHKRNRFESDQLRIFPS